MKNLGHPSIITFVDWCNKLGIKPCDERSVACYQNFVKAAKKGGVI